MMWMESDEADDQSTSRDGGDGENARHGDGGAESGDGDDADSQGDASGDQDDEEKAHCTLCYTPTLILTS